MAAFTVAAAIVSLVVPVQTAVAAEQITCRESASIYAVITGGDLREYFHNTPESGSYDWRPNRIIANSWSQTTVLAGPDGRLYQITNDGELRRFRHNGTEFDHPGNVWYTSLGTGWGLWRDAAYQNRITVDSKGDFYTIDNNGVLTWSRYDEQAATWTKKGLATGFGKFDMIVAAGDGVFYVRENGRNNGTLYRFHYHPDTQRWLQYQRLVNDGGWNIHRRVFSPGADVLYAVENSHSELWWYRWSDSGNSWATPTNLGGGWTADWQIGAMSNACTLAGLPLPQRPSPAPVQNLTRSELIESKNGLIQGFYVDAYGTLKSVTQNENSPIDFLNTAAIESSATFTTTPSAIMTKDSRPNVYALGTTTDTFEATRDLNGISWPAPSSFGGWTTGAVKAAKYADGRAQFFAVDEQHRLLARGQDIVDGPVTPWMPIGADLTGEVTAVPAGNDLEVLVTYSSGYIASSRYVNRALTNVRAVTAGPITGRAAAVVHNDGKTQIFARRADGKIHTLRDTASGFEPAWTTLDGITANGTPAAVIVGGRITLAVRSTDGFVYTNTQASPNSAFAGWTKLTDSRSGNAWPTDTEPSMVALSTGKVVLMYRSADEVTYTFESTPTTTSAAARTASAEPKYVGGPSPKPKR